MHGTLCALHRSDRFSQDRVDALPCGVGGGRGQCGECGRRPRGNFECFKSTCGGRVADVCGENTEIGQGVCPSQVDARQRLSTLIGLRLQLRAAAACISTLSQIMIIWTDIVGDSSVRMYGLSRENGLLLDVLYLLL